MNGEVKRKYLPINDLSIMKEMTNGEKKKMRFDLEERLIDFAVLMIQIADHMVETRAGNHIGGQIIRSGTHLALHYGEAQSAESRQDFIHKLKVLLKELRETINGLKIIKRASLCKKIELVEKAIPECNELISIFVKSITTAEENLKREKVGKAGKGSNVNSSVEPSPKKSS